MTNRRFISTALAFGLTALFSAPGGSAQPAQKKPLYLDAAQPIDKRVEDLLGRMTLSEKIGQMNMPCVYIDELGRDPAAKRIRLPQACVG